MVLSWKKLAVLAGTFTAGICGFIALRLLIETITPLPEHIGVEDGQFFPCPNTPNCVSTQSTRRSQSFEPIPFGTFGDTARQTMLQVLYELPSVRFISIQGDYIHIETRSPVFGFIDDTEIYFDNEAEIIHMRAAARLGGNDFGANRQRLKRIKANYQSSLR